MLYVSLVIAIAAFFGVQRYLESPLGHMLRAIKSNETRLEYLGTSARRVLLVGYVISAFLGGVGGALVAIIQQIATPEFGFWTKSGEFVFIAILGGGAHAFGAFAGAAMFEFVRFYASAQLADAWQLILGVVLIVIILYAPNGLIGLRQRDAGPSREVTDGQHPALRQRLKIRFGGVIAADGIDLDVYEGENLAIIGPNGAGKTTFLNISTGYLQAAGRHGELSWPRHHRASAAHDHQARHRPRLPDSATVPRSDRDGEHADRGRLAAADARPGSWRSRACRKRRRWSGCWISSASSRTRERKARELPEGKRKLVDIALALALKPKLLLMDEPTSGVASSEKLGIMDILTTALAKEKVTSVFVEHDMDMVERYANRVAVWNMGKIQKVGTPAEVLADPKVREQVIGI